MKKETFQVTIPDALEKKKTEESKEDLFSNPILVNAQGEIKEILEQNDWNTCVDYKFNSH